MNRYRHPAARLATLKRPAWSLMVLVLLCCPHALMQAATNSIGAADGSFESGLTGTTTSGTVELVPNLGPLLAIEGAQSVVISNPDDEGSTLADIDSSTLLIEDFTIGPAYTTLRLDYNFLTNELGPSFANDTFSVSLVMTTGDDEILLASDTFDSFVDAPWTGYEQQTGFRTLVADVSTFNDGATVLSLELRVDDVGDGRRDSAVMLDNLRLVEPGIPEARVLDPYVTIAPGEAFIFDGRPSSDDVGIAEYIWDFANGFGANGPLINMTEYGEQGFFQGTLTVVDDDDNSDTATFTVVVGDINSAPMITSSAVAGGSREVPYSYQVVADDAELAFGDVLQFSLNTAPAGMSIDADSGLISWTPPADADASNPVIVMVQDSFGGTDIQGFAIIMGPEVYVAAIRDDCWIYTARSLGNGSFDNFRSVDDIGTNCRGIAISDFDGDDDFDMVAGFGSSPSSHLFLYQREAGAFSVPVYLGTVGDSTASTGTWTMDMAAEDFNNDGLMDFVVNGDSANTFLMENTGALVTEAENILATDFETGTDGWSTSGNGSTVTRDNTTSSSGDWSMHVTASSNGSDLYSLINPADFLLPYGSTISFDYRIPAGTAVGLFIHVNGFNWISLGGSPGADPSTFPVSPLPVTLIADDQWHSIDMDIYNAIRATTAVGYSVSRFEFWSSNTASLGEEFWFDNFRISRPKMVSGFASKLLPSTGGNGRGVDAADADGDGNMDFARARHGDGHVYLYSGDGDGNFTSSASPVVDPGSNPYGVLLADFDADGVPDILANNSNTGDTYFYKGSGSGSYMVGVKVIDTNNYASLATYDFNNDGHMDVVATNYNSRQMLYFAGNGDGTFDPASEIANMGANTLAVAAPAGRVLGQPFAAATGSAMEVNTGDTVDFDASGSFDDGTIVSYEWDFGDGETGSGIAPSHLFATEGIFTVTLTVTDDAGFIDRAALRVIANGSPPVSAPGPAYLFDEGHALAGRWRGWLDGRASADAEGEISRYEWDFDVSDGIGVDATGPLVRPAYDAIGSFTVTLTVYDQNNQPGSATTTVTTSGGAPPVAQLSGPAALTEADASLGKWAGWYSSSATDDVGIASLGIDWADGSTTLVGPMADDFDDGDFSGWSVNGGTWSVIDQELAQTSTSGVWRWMQDLSRSYRDFQLEVDFKGIGSSPDGYLGIVFHNANNAGSEDSYLLYSRNSWDFWRFYDWATDTTLHEDGTGWDEGIWYHLRLVVVGDTMQLYVTPEGGTESLAIEFTEPNRHTLGGIGLLANAQNLRYDNVKVIPLDDQWTQDGIGPVSLAHVFDAADTYAVQLTAVDHAGQTDTAQIDTVASVGAAPLADPGGPYVLNEADADYANWNLVVDATASADDTHIERYRVDFGDGASYTAGVGSGETSSYFAVGTDLYGFDTVGANLQRIVATEDGTTIDIIDLSNGQVLASNSLDRMQSWNNVSPGDGVFFKVEADKPVVAYFTDLQNHSAFIPSLDGTPVGREFIFHRDGNQGFYVFAVEDSVVTFRNAAGAVIADFALQAGNYARPVLTDTVYHVVSSGRISMQTVGTSGYTTVPSDNGDGAGQQFHFATYSGTGVLAVFAHEAADIEVFDLDTQASLHTASIAAGEMWFQTGLGTRRMRLQSTADVEVWAGDVEAGTDILSMGDDVSFAGGRNGTEFVLHNLRDGIVIFAPGNNTEISVDGAVVATLPRDGFLRLEPTDFASGSGVHRVVSSKPVVIQTLGRANVFNDLGTYLGGVTLRHWYDAPGTYTLSLTVIDNVGQTDTATTTVEVLANAEPDPQFDAPAVAGESFAEGGIWTVDFNAGASSDDFRIAAYEWDFGDGSGASGAVVSHTYTVPGTYTTTLTVTDHAGQSVSLAKDIEITLGAGPQADAGGPYVLGEADASYAFWSVLLDGRGSTDDDRLFDFTWNFGEQLLDDHADGVLDEKIWTTRIATQADGVMQFAGSSGWNQGVYSRSTFEREEGVEFLGQVLDPSVSGSRNMMWGVYKANPSSYSFTQMPHAIYFNNGSLRIYENGSNRGNVGTFQRGVLYDVRIVVKAAGGASYFIREAGTTDWTALTSFTTVNPSDSPLRPGASHNSGGWHFDNERVSPEIQFGPTVEREFESTGVHPVTLTVRDHALQADSDSTTITIEAGDLPVANAAGPYTVEVGTFLNFNGTGSSDDNAIETFAWLFGDTTGGPPGEGSMTADLPFSANGPTPRHFYQAVGTYTAELTVTDNILQSDSTTAEVNVVVGDPPVAALLPVSANAANGPPAYFDGRASSDDFGVVEYRWDFDAEVDADGDGNFTNDIDAVGATPFHSYSEPALAAPGTLFSEPFDNEGVDSLIWLSAGATQTGGQQTVTGANSWGNRYATSVKNFARGRNSFRGEISHSGSAPIYMMWGLKNTNSNYSYTQMPHAIYFNNGTLNIYENGSHRGAVGSYDFETAYDVRIDPLAAGGADYYIREHGAADWTQLIGFNPLNATTASMKLHTVVRLGTATVDNLVVENAGPYMATLTVEDGAGQTSTAQQPVAVADNLPPDVITVPWVAFDPLVAHETYNGKPIRLKGIVRDADAATYQWDFGDGTQSAVMDVTDSYDLSISHTYPAAPSGTPFTAVLRVTDSAGNVGMADYPVIVRPKNLTTEINVAIDEGLWYLHQTQTRTSAEGYTTGYWTSNARASATASAIQSFEINGHLETVSHQEDPYAETVMRGLRQLFRDLGTVAIAIQTYGEPDTNGNGLGIQTGVNSSGGQPIYQGGQVMDAIAGSGTPLARTVTGAAGIKRRSYFDILTDMSDQFAWGQTEQGSGGSWRYSWNSSIDNSAAQWGAIGMLASQGIFGIPVPEWVKERNEVWLDNSYTGFGFGYTTGGTTAAGTPSGMVQMIFAGNDQRDTRWFTSEAWVANNWTSQYITNPGNRPYYPMYALTKSMRLAQPEAVVEFAATGLDWFRDAEVGIARTLIDDQMSTGRFPGTQWIQDQLRSAWGVIMLSRTLFVQPPVADAGKDRVWGVDRELIFDGSGSFHLDPFRSLVQYEWDFDGDGVFDVSSDQPTATHTYLESLYPADELPQTITVSLRVTDNNIPALSDTDTAEIIVAIPPHPPVADANGPYTCTAGLPCPLDGSGSFDIDPTDFISRHEWDLDGFPFDYTGATGETPEPVFAEGVFDISLRVWDNGVLNDLDGDDEVDEDEKLSDVDFAVVTAVPNLPPVADVGGPYEVPEGSALTLDAGASSDPNSDPLTYQWDLDNDGAFDDALGPNPSFLGVDDGSYPVTVNVTDGLLSTTASVDVVVTNVAPSVAAGPDQTVPEGSPVNFAGSFTDPGIADTHTFAWDFADGGGNTSSLTPSHTYSDDDTYVVRLTVTDDDLGEGSDTLTVTVTDLAPTADITGDATLTEGDSGSFDAGGSTSAPDAIVSYEWDWDFDGSFSPSGDTGITQSHPYPESGQFVAAVRVTDDDGSQHIDTLTVTVINAPPVVEAGDDQGGLPGADIVLDPASFTDLGVQDTHTAVIDWGDGTIEAGTVGQGAGSGTVAGSHQYASPDTYTVTVTVTDDEGGSGSDTLQITIDATPNTPPQVDPGAGANINEGATFSGGGSFIDPDADSWTATVDYGDGSGVQALALAGMNFNLSHRYVEDGSYLVTVSVNDGTADGTATLTVTVNNVAPSVNAGSDQGGLPGADIVLDPASFTDPGVQDTHTAVIDWGDGTIEAGSVGQGAGSGTVAGSHQYASAATYTVTVTVTDDEGDSGSDSLVVEISPTPNVPPAVDAGNDASINEGATFTRSGSFADADSSAWTASVDYGDGSAPQVLPLAGMNFNLSHLYVEDGSYPVTVTVNDGTADGTATLTVTVDNVAPSVNAGNDQGGLPGADIVLDPASFTDPGVQDTHTAQIDWGDGTIEAGTVDQGAGSGTVAGSHQYASADTYTVTVTVTDDEGDSGSDSLVVEISPTPNVPPAVSAGDDASISEGATFSRAGSFTDADSSAWTATVDYGDGSGVQALPLAGMNFNLSHRYVEDGSYPVTVTVNDGTADGTATLTVTVNNVAPVVEAGSDQNLVLPAAAVVLDPALFTDAGVEDTHTATIDWDDGTVDAGIVSQGAGSGTVDASHSYTATGTYTVTVRVTDDEGDTGSDTLVIEVSAPPNTAPQVDAGADASINEGDTFSGGGGFVDPDSDTWSATVNYGDGSGDVSLPLSGQGFNLSHVYVQDGSYTVRVTVDDGENPPASDSLTVLVGNLPPVVDAGGDQGGLQPGDPVSLDPASFTDPGIQDTHTATINWGDGTGDQPAVVTQGAGSGSVASDHSYANAGDYSVTVTVTDSFGAVGSDSLLITVDQPDPGGVACDIDGDNDVDSLDIRLIIAARNTPADPPGADPRDNDGSGTIDVNDARQCTLQCHLPGCAVVTPGG